MMEKITWVNDSYKEKHESRLKLASSVYEQLELLTVQHGVRKCALIGNINPGEIDLFDSSMSQKGLVFLPLSKDKVGNAGEFGHVSNRPTGNDRFTYRMCVGKTMEDVLKLIACYNEGNNEGVGRLLGYPDCCTKFFSKEWSEGHYDPIVAQFENTAPSTCDGVIKKITIPDTSLATSHMRYVGLRVVAHFACSLNCEESMKIVDKWVEVGRKENIMGLDECIDFLNQKTEIVSYNGKVHVSCEYFGFNDITETHSNPIIITIGGVR